MPTPWYYIAGFGVIAWALFAIASKLRVGVSQEIVSGVIGVAGIASGVIAGVYAEQTFIASIVRWVVSIHPVVTFAGFIILVLAAIITLAAIIPDRWSPGASASLPMAIAWIFIPSALSSGALHGTWGAGITSATVQISGILVKATSGAWG